MLEPVGSLCITEFLAFDPLVAPYYGSDFPTEYRSSPMRSGVLLLIQCFNRTPNSHPRIYASAPSEYR